MNYSSPHQQQFLLLTHHSTLKDNSDKRAIRLSTEDEVNQENMMD